MRHADPARFAFAFIALSAGLCAGAEKQTFFLRPNGAIPFLEVVTPGDDGPKGFLVGK